MYHVCENGGDDESALTEEIENRRNCIEALIELAE
jgi:hypothetical protein